MLGQAPNWSAQQLAEFLAALSGCRDEAQATRIAIERAAEALEAEIAAVVRGGAVVAAVGFPRGRIDTDTLAAVASGASQVLEVPGLGRGRAFAAQLDESPPATLVLARAGEEGFTPEEVSVVRGMARVLTLTVRTLRVLDAERSLRERIEAQAEENVRLLSSLRQRQRLLEQTSRIHRLILRRRPLAEVLEAITRAAGELLGAEIATLRMIAEDDPAAWVMVASTGIPPERLEHLRRGAVGVGAGGRAISEQRLIVMENYREQPGALPVHVEAHVEAAIATPVHEHDRVVGSLVVGSHVAGRSFDDAEKEMLLAFAEQVNLALLDAKTVELVSHQALHDSLTGLPNRALFLDRLHQSLERASRRATRSGVLFIDLDRFKTVNDSFGHAAGDEVLRLVGDRLRACVRGEDTAARLGGDEFAVLTEGLGDRRDAATLAERIIAALEEPIVTGGRAVRLSASVGIALGSQPEDDLLRDADVAMYRAKNVGGAFEFFEPGMRTAIIERIALEEDLRRASERSQLRLHYQPIVDLSGGRIVGVEALVRWQHPTRGLLHPGEFVSMAEETGAVVPLGRWVLREACRQAAAWRAGGCDVGISVNVSVRQLEHPTLVPDVAAALADSALEPSRLTLEITETILVGEDATRAKLSELASLGVRLALDDFGVGYSSLRYLAELPFDILKIPKSFVDRIDSASAAAPLVEAIIDLGAALDLTVVAEGVETGAELVHLRRIGCPLGQGFLFARPDEPAAVGPLLDRVLLPSPTTTIRAA